MMVDLASMLPSVENAAADFIHAGAALDAQLLQLPAQVGLAAPTLTPGRICGGHKRLIWGGLYFVPKFQFNTDHS
jgi:hypothetical protein